MRPSTEDQLHCHPVQSLASRQSSGRIFISPLPYLKTNLRKLDNSAVFDPQQKINCTAIQSNPEQTSSKIFISPLPYIYGKTPFPKYGISPLYTTTHCEKQVSSIPIVKITVKQPFNPSPGLSNHHQCIPRSRLVTTEHSAVAGASRKNHQGLRKIFEISSRFFSRTKIMKFF